MARLPSFMISMLVFWSVWLIIIDASSCGGTFKSNYGEITSPDYSSRFGSNLSCVWKIEGSTGSRLVIGFIAFSLRHQSGCSDDYIEIRHGNIPSSRYCGTKIPDRVITRNQNATIEFVAYPYRNLSGFHLYWKVFVEPMLMSIPVSWESANVECERNGGKLMEPDLDYLDSYKDSIIEWMGAHNVSEIWERKYFTPWVFLKGCILKHKLDLKRTFTVKNNLQTTCQNLCSGYNYFGLQQSECSCLNDFVPSYDSCSYPCEGNAQELCGGANAYTLYKNNFCHTSSKVWNGTLTKNIYGSSCLNWNESIYQNSTFPDGSADDAGNYCRDPEGDRGAPGCFLYSPSSSQWTRCDVYECVDVSEKQNGSSECIAILKNGNRLGPYRFTGIQMPCSTNLSGIAMYLDSKYNPHFNETAGSYNHVRNLFEPASLWFPFSTEYEHFYEIGRFYWTGMLRNTSTLSQSAAPSDCFKLLRREQTLVETTDQCSSMLPFICQKVPVNCGQSFKQTDSRLNFSLDSGNNDMNCEWKIEGFDNTFIQIDISFDLEKCHNCECDSLKLFDASSTIGPPNKTVCGIGNLTFNSTQKAITLAYSSDRSVAGTGFQAQWSFVTLPSKSNKSKSSTGSEDASQNKFSVGLIGGIIAVVVVIITASVIICVVVKRRREPSKRHQEAKQCSIEILTSNNESETPCDIYSVSAKVNIRKAIDSVQYGAVNKRQINNQESSTRNIPINSGKNSNITEITLVNDKMHTSCHHSYDSIACVLKEATSDDDYNRLNEITETEYVNKIDNVYSHIQGSDSDIYDHTADAPEMHDRRSSYSHVKGPFPPSGQLHGTEHDISNMYDHTTDVLEDA